ncbi:MAG: hypothetical protein LRY71_01630 [Bacillaceae bacterium]|nr:hypothetical protein [Bacillaceae bacterium]
MLQIEVLKLTQLEDLTKMKASGWRDDPRYLDNKNYNFQEILLLFNKKKGDVVQ